MKQPQATDRIDSNHSQKATTAPMIVNSQPYNPSQQAQQQRCIGLSQQQQHMISSTSNNRLTGQQQQNSLYGSTHLTATTTTTNQPNLTSNTMQATANQRQSSHMLDLMANLHQNAFDSAYDDTTSSLITSTTANNSGSQQNGVNQSLVINQQQQQDGQLDHQQRNLHHQRHSITNNANDVSLYSPSSSTSLLYHIYDQINDHQTQQQQQQSSKKNNSTILNPANLFGQQQQQQQQVPPTTTIQLHQQQMSQAAEFQKLIQQQQSLYSGQYSQQQPFNTMHHQHSAYLGAQQDGQMMLDSVIRQQHHAATLARQSHRPLSSSGASSMSGQSMALTYGRQPRVPVANQGKSQTNLASVLQSHQTLNHLGLGQTNGSLTPTSCVVGPPKKFTSHFASGSVSVGNKKWKRAQQRARKMVYEYSIIFKCSILLILLAFSLMSIIKFTIMNPSQQQQATNNQMISTPTSSSNINSQAYPPTFKFDVDAQMQTNGQPTQISDTDLELTDQQRQQKALGSDVLKSKVLIGEFVVLSQNYSHSAAQKSMLAENIVKLMDQVFLATNVRGLYSRTEVTNIRPNRPAGIIVDFNIILSDSIGYAAQQFGYSLYDSLAKSNERLASQQSFIIDKSSIRFNTVPDKDLKSGIVPPGLIADSVTRELVVTTSSVQQSEQSPTGSNNNQPSIDLHFNEQVGPINPLLDSQQPTEQQLADNSVVWSEWSQWSSCNDKDGVCSPTRIHSRIRKCLSQLTGEKVDMILCKQKFNMQDQHLELAECSQVCANQQFDSRPMSDAPSVIGPQTAPSVLIGNEQPTFLLPPPPPPPPPQPIGKKHAKQQQQPELSSVLMAASTRVDGTLDGPYSSQPNGEQQAGKQQPNSQQQQQQQASSTTEKIISQIIQQGSSTLASIGSQPNEMLITPISVPTLLNNQQQQQQISCSNCTSGEICLLLMQQKVPFCAKVKDRQDESGCGGWCKAQNQVCQPVGQNAFKCIHDSECLQDEWRCHDSACIPSSKRCDGHSNCYDNSDERDCPS